MNNIDEHLVETVWQDLDKQVSREQIRRVVAEISLAFQDATVTAFVPIFVHRRAVDQLQKQLDENRLPDNGKRPFVGQQRQGNALVAKYTTH